MSRNLPKIAIFVWDGGKKLSRSFDLDALMQKLGKSKGVVRCEMISSPRGDYLARLAEDLEGGVVDRILWVGPFSRDQVKFLEGETRLKGLNTFLHEWCDLEVQGLFLPGLDRDIINKKARLLLDMALARTRLLESLDPVELPASNAALIIGAGAAGIHTAVSLTELGKRVFLVERESGAGGKVALLSRFYPRLCDPHCGLQHALEKLGSSDLAELHTLSTVSAIAGSPGNFFATIKTRPRFVDGDLCNGCGSCVQACPVRLDTPGGSNGKSAVGEALLKPFLKPVHPSIPMPFPGAFVIEREHCPPQCRECEKACPAGAVRLDQAPSEKTLNVGAVIVTTGWDPYSVAKVSEYGYDLDPRIISNLEMERVLGSAAPSGFAPVAALRKLKDIGFIQCAGSRDKRHLPYCSSVCCSATLKQALALKEQAPEANCYVFCMDMRSSGFNEDLYLRARELGVIFIKERPESVTPDKDSGRLGVRVIDPVLGRWLHIDLDLMVLAGGMEPALGASELSDVLNLPRNCHGFFESHPQCHPEESQRTGIYAGGCAKGPMNVSQSIESAHLAAMKALKFLDGRVLAAPTYPVVDKNRCDQCKRCVEECPFSSFTFDDKNFPVPDLAKCRQCGNCMGVCPLGVISLRHHTIKQTAAQVEAIDTNFIGSGEPVVLAFLCENDAYLAARSAVELGLPVPPNVVAIKVPCAGSINNTIVADALSFGIDGVLIAGCPDDQCHFLKGSRLVRKRSGDLGEKLKAMMIEPERVRFDGLEIRESGKYVEILQDYIRDLKAMGPNPFKI